MKWLNRNPRLYRRDDPVPLASTAHERAPTRFSPNTPPRTTTVTATCRRSPHDLNVAAQNRTKLTTFDHPNRTISSAQRHFRGNAPQNLFSPRPRRGKGPSATGRPSTVQPRPGLTKPDHPDHTISSAQQYFSPNSPQNFSALTTQPRSSLDPWPAVRRTPIARDQDRTKPNKAEHHRTPERTISSAQRHFRRKTPENLLAPNTPNERREPTTSSPRAA